MWPCLGFKLCRSVFVLKWWFSLRIFTHFCCSTVTWRIAFTKFKFDRNVSFGDREVCCHSENQAGVLQKYSELDLWPKSNNSAILLVFCKSVTNSEIPQRLCFAVCLSRDTQSEIFTTGAESFECLGSLGGFSPLVCGSQFEVFSFLPLYTHYGCLGLVSWRSFTRKLFKVE